MSDLLYLQKTGKKYIEQLETVFPYASLFAQEVGGQRIISGTREENVSFLNPEKGFVLQVFNGKNLLEYASNKISDDELEKGVRYLMEYKGTVTDKGLTIDPGEKLDKVFYQEMKQDPRKEGIEKMLIKARENKNLLQSKSEKIAVVFAVLGHTHTNELFINRNKNLYQELHRFDSMAQVVFAENGKSAMMFSGDSRIGGFENSDFEEKTIEKIIKDGEKVLKAERMVPGYYKAIFSPEMAGMFAHEAFGHGTETDMFLKKRAKGEEYMGKQVAAKLVNMYDGPCIGDAAANYFFDNEGELARTTQVIKEGTLVSGLSDLYSSVKLGIKRTPNGRRQNYSHKAYARMTNTYFEKGKDKLEDMISGIDHGFFVNHATNGMEDPKGWGIQLEALYAEEIKEGKLTGKVFSPVIVTGYVPELLMSIDAVSDDFKISGLGYCGKGHKEWVKVTDGGPYLRLMARLA